MLRRLRDGAGLTIDQVAEKLDVSPSTISRIETAHVRVRPRDLRDLLDMYEVTGAQRDELLQIARERHHQAWWHEFKGLPKHAFAGFEADASSIAQYSVQLIPGLLQTEAYARAILDAIHLDARRGDNEKSLQLRLDRQALLTREQAPQYWVILDEAALRRVIGGRGVMKAQLERLIDVAALPNVTLQVLPFAAGEHAAMDGEFTILHYPDTEDPDVVYIENTAGDLYLEDPKVTRRYNWIFDHLRAAALDRVGSVKRMTELHNELDQSERR
jgi:transcriptional regulator with XRE-family HTH domain